jgi:hypothetical protein
LTVVTGIVGEPVRVWTRDGHRLFVAIRGLQSLPGRHLRSAVKQHTQHLDVLGVLEHLFEVRQGQDRGLVVEEDHDLGTEAIEIVSSAS